jgi:hypothetical protein
MGEVRGPRQPEISHDAMKIGCGSDAGRQLSEDLDRVLCVPKTLSVLISHKNRLTPAHHDRAAVFRNGRLRKSP